MAGLKDERAIRDALSRRLARGLFEHVGGVRQDWPYTLSLGRPSKQQILDGFADIARLTQTLRSWEQELGVSVEYAMREAGGPQRLPARIEVPSIEAAAALALPRPQEPWTRTLQRTQERATALSKRFAEVDAAGRARVLRALDDGDDLAFELLLAAGTWFRDHDAGGLTARQVPLPGIDGKWLDNARRRSLVCLLAGKEDLGLVGAPQRVDFAYVDPDHLARGGRHYDSWIQGDVAEPAYAPCVVVVVENKDTYLNFPQAEGGICVFGSGRSGMALVSRLPWVGAAERVVYWGDLDADGFEILDGYRERGIACESILMDAQTLERFGRFGTNLEKDHKTRIMRARKDLKHLTAAEREAYLLITDDAYPGNRRLEQEKIPLTAALAALHRA